MVSKIDVYFESNMHLNFTWTFQIKKIMNTSYHIRMIFIMCASWVGTIRVIDFFSQKLSKTILTIMFSDYTIYFHVFVFHIPSSNESFVRFVVFLVVLLKNKLSSPLIKKHVAVKSFALISWPFFRSECFAQRKRGHSVENWCNSSWYGKNRIVH